MIKIVFQLYSYFINSFCMLVFLLIIYEIEDLSVFKVNSQENIDP